MSSWRPTGCQWPYLPERYGAWGAVWQLRLDIKAPHKCRSGFTPIGPLYKIEHAFAQLGRWRRLSRCYEGSQASASAWLEVASVGYLLGRATT